MKDFKKEALILYAVTDSRLLKGKALAEAVEEAILGGATMIQLRDKRADENMLLKYALEVKEITKKYNVPLIINDNINVCIKAGADGVHLGQSDTDPAEARKLLGEDKIIGVSAKTREQAEAAALCGADYLGVGAAFATDTKTDARAIDHGMYNIIKDASGLPIVAIGGINEKNIHLLSGCRIDGVAVVSGIFGKDDIKKAAEEIRALSEKYFIKKLNIEK